jgi:DNA-binding transcriptional ArsR family regulator
VPLEHSQPEPRDVQCAEYLRALADPIRLKIIRSLQSGALTVTDIGLLLELEITRVSHHLRVLFHADLVATERDGKFIYYRLNRQFLKRAGVNPSLDFGCCKIDLKSSEKGQSCT